MDDYGLDTGSIALFEGLNFKQTASGVNYFGEVELRWTPDLAALRRRQD